MSAPLPDHTTWSLESGWTGNAVDEYGVLWKVTKDVGWGAAPAPRTDRTSRAATDGVHPSRSTRDARLILLEGKAEAPDAAARDAAIDRLTALFADGRGQILTVADRHLTRQAYVELDGEPSTDALTTRVFSWSLRMLAPDPVKYGPDLVQVVGLPGRGDAPGLLDDPGSPAGPAQRTNVASNPSLTVDTAGWSGFRGTVARDTAVGGDGAALRATADGTSATDLGAILTAPAAFAAAGQTWTLSFDVRATSAQIEGWRAYFRDGASGTIASSASVTAFPLDGGWHRVSFTATLAAPADRIYLIARSPSGLLTAGTQVWFDRVLIERAASAGSYFDGDTADTELLEYVWTGTPHASSSIVRTPAAPGGLTQPLADGWTAAAAGELVVPNDGTVAYWPRLRVDGPVTNPRVELVETGAWLRLGMTIPAGQYVDLLLRDRRVLLQGVGSRRFAVTYAGDWLAVPPGGGTLRWSADEINDEAHLWAWTPQGAWL